LRMILSITKAKPPCIHMHVCACLKMTSTTLVITLMKGLRLVNI
jgi:hypothetical protein